MVGSDFLAAIFEFRLEQTAGLEFHLKLGLNAVRNLDLDLNLNLRLTKFRSYAESNSIMAENFHFQTLKSCSFHGW